MLISICAPCHNRTYDLKKTLPTWIEAANASPPVEIVILNYNSPDDLDEYMESMQDINLVNRNFWICKKYIGRNYYHMAHARNLSVLATHGKYFIEMNADSLMSLDFISTIRDYIARYHPVYITVNDNKGIIVLPKSEFIAAGGYDERFEFYSPEDKDLSDRLVRRGFKPIILPLHYAPIIKTSDEEKVKNYRLKLSKRDMAKIMSPIYHENKANNVLVANEGREWGQWMN